MRENPEVDEPDCGSGGHLNQSEPVLNFEFEVIPEAKLLSSENLKYLIKKHESFMAVARIIGASQAFVRQKSSACQLKSHASTSSRNDFKK